MPYNGVGKILIFNGKGFEKVKRSYVSGGANHGEKI